MVCALHRTPSTFQVYILTTNAKTNYTKSLGAENLCCSTSHIPSKTQGMREIECRHLQTKQVWIVAWSLHVPVDLA